MRTPKGRYVAAKTASKKMKPRIAAVDDHPSLPGLPQVEKRKASPIARLQAKQRLVQAQKSAAFKAVESLQSFHAGLQKREPFGTAREINF